MAKEAISWLIDTARWSNKRPKSIKFGKLRRGRILSFLIENGDVKDYGENWPCRSKRMAVISLMTSVLHFLYLLLYLSSNLFFIPAHQSCLSSVTFSSFLPKLFQPSLLQHFRPPHYFISASFISGYLRSKFPTSQSKQPSEEFYCLKGIWFCCFQSWSETPLLLWESKAHRIKPATSKTLKSDKNVKLILVIKQKRFKSGNSNFKTIVQEWFH